MNREEPQTWRRAWDIEMLKELVSEIDYDIFKDMFEYEAVDISPLLDIIEKYR